MGDANSILVGTIAGIIGGGYLMYGKKQKQPVAMVCGALLIVIPYVVDNALLLLVAGVALCVAPFYFRE